MPTRRWKRVLLVPVRPPTHLVAPHSDSIASEISPDSILLCPSLTFLDAV